MRKLAPVVLVLALLTACGGDDDTGSSSSSSSSSSNSSSSSTSSSSSSNSSSTSSSSSSSSSGGFVGDKARGMTLYGQLCQSCHGTEGVDIKNGGDAAFPLDAGKFTLASLMRKIDIDMPPAIGATKPSDCAGQCAADVAAYVITWTDDVELSCDTQDPVTYSPRRLRLLTVNEYQNTLQDLLGVTKDYRQDVLPDDKKGKFPNNATANVDEGRANKFWNIASEVAAWAVENSKPFACTATADCATPFIEDFAYRAFRRPLTQAEITVFEDIFSAYPGAEGMELALVTVLNSPQFLYRSEMGRLVADVLTGADVEPRYVPENPQVFPPDTLNGGSAPVDGFSRVPLYNAKDGGIGYTFTGDDIMTIRLRGTYAADAWPTLHVNIDNKRIATQVVDFAGAKTLTFRIEGVSGGNKYMRLENQGAHTQSRDLYIGDITLGKAVLEIPSKGDEEKLMQADADSYVLTPFELATYLSYTLTGSTPDATLLEAAANEGLDYPEQILAQVNRLLDTPSGRQQMGVFAGYWFDTDKIVSSNYQRDNTQFPNYTMPVREAMAEEVRQLFRTVFFDKTGKFPFESFYTGDFTVLNSILANYYGIDAGTTSANDWRVVENLEKRGGILTTGAFMTVNAHIDKTAPIIRAVRVREQMLCQHIDPPPLLVEDRQHLLELAEAEYKQGIATSRRYYEVITDAASCDGCHEYQINPMFGMEDFDQVGQWRSTQKGSTGMTLEIDKSGFLYGPENITDTATRIPFQGAKGLSKVLGSLPGAHECLVEKTFRYATGMAVHNKAVDPAFEPPLTEEQREHFACAAQNAEQAFEAANNSPRAVMAELVMQDFVRFRKPE